MLPPHPTDERHVRDRTQRDTADASGSRGVTGGDIALLSGLVVAVVIVLVVLVTIVFF